MSNRNHAITQSEQNNSSLALGGRGVGTLVEPVKNEPCETACRMAEGGKKDVAFTLAEVLITLGVIGVVAA